MKNTSLNAAVLQFGQTGEPELLRLPIPVAGPIPSRPSRSTLKRGVEAVYTPGFYALMTSRI
jgi:hypothetical protein